MYLASLREMLRRHVVLAVLAVLVTAAAMTGVSTVVKPGYQAQGSVVLIPPATSDDPKANRYLALGTLDQAVGVVLRSVMSQQTQLEVDRTAPGGTFEVAPDYTTSAPILVVTATGDSRAATRAVLAAALGAIPEVVERLQSAIGVDASQQITSQGLTRDTDATMVLKPVIRALLAVAVVLLGGSLGLIALLDGLQQRRRRLRLGRPAGREAEDAASGGRRIRLMRTGSGAEDDDAAAG